jgi:hypothetical protein
LVALVNLILFFAFPRHSYFGTPTLIVPKLYANTILAVLNARIRILDGRATYVSASDFTEILISHPSYIGNGQSDDGATTRFRRTPVLSITTENLSSQIEKGVEMKVIRVCVRPPKG